MVLWKGPLDFLAMSLPCSPILSAEATLELRVSSSFSSGATAGEADASLVATKDRGLYSWTDSSALSALTRANLEPDTDLTGSPPWEMKPDNLGSETMMLTCLVETSRYSRAVLKLFSRCVPASVDFLPSSHSAAGSNYTPEPLADGFRAKSIAIWRLISNSYAKSRLLVLRLIHLMAWLPTPLGWLNSLIITTLSDWRLMWLRVFFSDASRWICKVECWWTVLRRLNLWALPVSDSALISETMAAGDCRIFESTTPSARIIDPSKFLAMRYAFFSCFAL